MSDARVLVVEDEAIVAEDIAQFVRSLGHEVVGPFGKGEDALAHPDVGSADIALLDIHLAGRLDGIETARALMARGVGLVFLTAYADEDTLHRAKLAQPYGYVVKPFDERSLRAALEVALHKRGVERALERERELVAALLHGAQDAILGVDMSGRVIFANARAEELLGVRASDLAGRSVLDALHLEAHGAASLDEGLARAIATGQPRKLPEGTALLDAEGFWIPVAGAVSPVRSPAGIPRAALIVLRDVQAERRVKALEAEVRSLRDALAERMRRLV